MQGGSETILLVEDYPNVRAMLATALRELGYNVLEASSGTIALQLAQEYPGDIHILISDVVMPEMGGIELARHFIALYPDTKILLMSGYVNEMEVNSALSDTNVEFLSKPFPITELSEKIRQILDQ